MSSLHHPSCFCSRCPENLLGAVTFAVGTLDGDPVKLNLLKDYVSKALYNLVTGWRASSFNVIYFSEEVHKWCDRTVTWTPDTANQAISWIRTLTCDSGADPSEALAAAFEDPSCQTVYLVMDTLPPRVLQNMYNLLARDDNACSVNVVYLREEPNDWTREGAFRSINLKPLGSSNMIRINGHQRPSHYCPSSSSSSSCSFSTVVSSEPQLEPINCCVHPKELPSTVSPVQLAPEVLSLFRGARVLARRDTDGLYYIGHIAREVEGSSDRFLVEFEKCRSLKGKSQFRMQETPVCDIIHYEDARWRPLSPGDHVLAPVDAKMENYGPGTVLQGKETRARGLAFDSTGVLVTFWNGKTKQVPPGLAIWIPQTLGDRITLELYIPPETRKKLIETCTSFPFMGTTDNHLECQAEEKSVVPGSHTCHYCGPDTGVCQKCHVPNELWVALRNSLNHINRITTTKEKFTQKDKAPKKDEEPVKQKLKLQRKNIRDQGGHQISRHKEPLLRTRDTQTENHINPTDTSYNRRREDGGTMDSSYKPSLSRLGNVTHLQETLMRIERAMKEDRRTMESVILDRRPRSNPLKLNYEAKFRRNQELREQKEEETAELQRTRVEERQRRKGERMRELEQRELMLQDNRRLRSQQRILLDLEKRQDQEGLEVQQAESRRATAEERSRKKDEDLRKEWKREDQKVQFWRDLRKQRESLDLEMVNKQQEKDEKYKDLLQKQVITQQRQQEAALQDQRRHQQKQEGSKSRVSKRLEDFYQQAERESQKDKDLQQYLKEQNLQALRSAMVL
ncbi:uncharacterized protein [Phyllobates terribilis]|uniref:uncharacterized protein n=1 Tax=Phyllobates terribilis TaxID=111132 RepID=UPI003CCAD550